MEFTEITFPRNLKIHDIKQYFYKLGLKEVTHSTFGSRKPHSFQKFQIHKKYLRFISFDHQTVLYFHTNKTSISPIYQRYLDKKEQGYLKQVSFKSYPFMVKEYREEYQQLIKSLDVEASPKTVFTTATNLQEALKQFPNFFITTHGSYDTTKFLFSGPVTSKGMIYILSTFKNVVDPIRIQIYKNLIYVSVLGGSDYKIPSGNQSWCWPYEKDNSEITITEQSLNKATEHLCQILQDYAQ